MGLVADPNASNTKIKSVFIKKEKSITITTTIQPNHDRFWRLKLILRSENINIKTIFTLGWASLIEEVFKNEI
jgi:hypothetical protein